MFLNAIFVHEDLLNSFFFFFFEIFLFLLSYVTSMSATKCRRALNLENIYIRDAEERYVTRIILFAIAARRATA